MRRFAITLVAWSLGSWPALAIATDASQPEKQHRIAVIGFHSPGLESRMIADLRERLVELGYVEGRNLSIVYRWADGVPGNYTAIGQGLAAEKLDAIVAPCGAGARAVRSAQPTIPLVVRGIDLTSCGSEIGSLERPGGNMTGAIYFHRAQRHGGFKF